MRVESLGVRQRGRGRLEDTKRPLITQYAGPVGLGRRAIRATRSTLDLFKLIATDLGS